MPNQLGQVVLYIIGAIAIIIAAYYTTYYLGKRSIKTAAGRNIRIHDRFALSKDKSFCLVEVKGKVYLVAVTSRSVTLLDTLSAEEFAAQGESSAASSTPGYAAGGGLSSFLTRFWDAMKSNFSSAAKPRPGSMKGLELYDLDKRITLQNAKEEDNLDAVFREIQTGRAKRRATASRGEDDEES